MSDPLSEYKKEASAQNKALKKAGNVVAIIYIFLILGACILVANLFLPQGFMSDSTIIAILLVTVLFVVVNQIILVLCRKREAKKQTQIILQVLLSVLMALFFFMIIIR